MFPPDDGGRGQSEVPPTIVLPFPLRANRRVADAERHTRAWARQSGLLRSAAASARFDAARFATLAGYVHPDAPLERLSLYSQWLAWQFLADDQYGEGGYRTAEGWQAAVAHLRPVFATGITPPASSPLASALSNLLGRIYPSMSAPWRDRFASRCRETFGAVSAENLRRSMGVVADVDQYVSNRRAVSSGLPCLALNEFVVGAEVRSDIADSGPYRTLTVATVDVIAWINDLYSWQKEEAVGEVDNFVLVLQHADDISRQQAMYAVARRIVTRVDEFETAEEALSKALDAAHADRGERDSVERCVDAMRNWMAGTLAWSVESARYGPVGRVDMHQIPAYVDDLLSTPLD
jgi:hypothetical protein